MKAWVDLQLNQMRANIKMTKMNRTNAGETNQFIDDHEKEGIIRPSQTHRKTVERHATTIPKFPKINETTHTKKLKPIIEKLFKDHPGNTSDFWLATEYSDVVKLLDFFIKEKSNFTRI